MGPIETYFATIAIIFVFISVARGYAKELSTTIIILVAIFLLDVIDGRLNPLLLALVSTIFPDFDRASAAADTLLCVVYSVAFIGSVFANYSGNSLNLGGSQAAPPVGTYISILVGLMNGYLVAGTLWFYQALYDYPLKFFGRGIEQPLSSTAQAMVELLPQKLALNAGYLMIPIAVILLLRARG
ncbi:MAG: hypothetical protein KJZ86_24535 [Caldilineaceae bacterium]|nr:hypothetical protein [Caldilineaceae bacterium]HRJ40373.1 hypothetical protein [Caldilineaceae bacterium]